MALGARRTIFGVHSVTPYSRIDGAPYGTALVVQSGSFTMEGSTIPLMGGSNRFAWEIEDGDIEANLSFSVSEYPNWLFTLFGGKAPTVGSAESGGYVSAITNIKGALVNGTTGITSTASIATAADLKGGRYILRAATSSTIDVYALSNVDFGRGTPGDYLDDSLKIATLTITTGNDSLVPNFGFEVTGGSGTIGLSVGDTAELTVRPPNTFNRSVVIGGIADEFPEFGAIIAAQKKGSGAVFTIDAYKLKNLGLTLGAERKAWGQNEYTAGASYDSVKNGICKIEEFQP